MFGTPRFWLWACRIVPLVVGGAWLYGLIFTDAFTPPPPVGPLQIILAPDTLFDGFGTELLAMALVLLLVPYLLVVLIVLPALLLPAEQLRFKSVAAYLLFAVLTAGFGPYFWYLLTVDPILSRMVGQRLGLTNDHAA